MKKPKKCPGTRYEIQWGIQRMGVGKPINDNAGYITWRRRFDPGYGKTDPNHVPNMPLRSGTIPLMLRGADGVLRVAA